MSTMAERAKAPVKRAGNCQSGGCEFDPGEGRVMPSTKVQLRMSPPGHCILLGF